MRRSAKGRRNLAPADWPGPSFIVMHSPGFDAKTISPVWRCPVHTGLADFIENEDLLSRPLFVAVSRGLGNAYKRESNLPPTMRRALAAQRQQRRTYLETVRIAERAGVPITAGSDAGSPGTSWLFDPPRNGAPGRSRAYAMGGAAPRHDDGG